MQEYEADFEKMYFALFQRILSALDAMEEQNFGQAKDILKKAQQETEEMYMGEE